MNCPICNGEKVVWQGGGPLGILQCKPCPNCHVKPSDKKEYSGKN